jgi:hypothetical protein
MMKQTPKTPSRQRPNPAFAGAFARLDAAVAKAETPSDLTESEKTQIWIQTLWGRLPENLRK